ncbi:hypothetical protein AsFPU1_1885 [Aphanothece sacrum FPU1]|uniref:Type II toxin-antitoxin system Phd/YefM family antitoxin n=1 Tax=Aphanothece sacrum FPU1 TaxID=1920663 RepID=A0A401IGY3_APHSA|nr:hypothetical protein [Aphanothece sacrum]GBF80484.1 hypothetical protein AsFPU1_1885 [Aphanothece sacrum FPU1]GBF86375.1 hypothetical protein AsFPU3_3446 [Aphanothece sacrum FPU3]
MIELHPEFLTKNGKKEFAVLSYEEFLKIQELLEDLEDLEDLSKAKDEEKDSPSYSLDEVKKMFNQDHPMELAEKLINENKSNGRKMAEALRKISKNNTFSEVDPQQWQQEIRQDRPLPNRD